MSDLQMMCTGDCGQQQEYPGFKIAHAWFVKCKVIALMKRILLYSELFDFVIMIKHRWSFVFR